MKRTQFLRMFFSISRRWSFRSETKRYLIHLLRGGPGLRRLLTISLCTAENESNLIENHHTVQVKLADQQADPNSPLYSVKSFEELGLYVQAKAIARRKRHENWPIIIDIGSLNCLRDCMPWNSPNHQRFKNVHCHCCYLIRMYCIHIYMQRVIYSIDA